MSGRLSRFRRALFPPGRSKLNDRAERRLKKLAKVRGEDPAETERYLQRLLPKLIPSRAISPERFSDMPILETGLDGALAYVRLENGRTLFSHPSSPRRLRQYWVIRDKLPKTIRPEAFGAAFDVARRYVNADVSELSGLTGGTIIEGGAYIGHKAIRFADELGPDCRVIAIEIDEANYQIMRRNIEVNGLQDQIIPVNAGLWSSTGRFVSIANNYQRHSLAQVDKIDRNRRREVECTTLDALIDEHGLDSVDYVNIQVNGAELEVLKGCERHLSRIGRFGINSKYVAEDERIQPLVLAWLKEHRFKVGFKGSNEKRIIAEPLSES